MAQFERNTEPQPESAAAAESSSEPKVTFCDTTTAEKISDKELISLEESSVPTFSLPADLDTPVITRVV